jgi:putative acetyltransferase
VTGHVLLSGCRLDAPRRIVDVLTLSPVGVLAAGIGTRLVGHALEAADGRGVPLVFLEGSPEYYGRRGVRAGQRGRLPRRALRHPGRGWQWWPTRTGTR